MSHFYLLLLNISFDIFIFRPTPTSRQPHQIEVQQKEVMRQDRDITKMREEVDRWHSSYRKAEEERVSLEFELNKLKEAKKKEGSEIVAKFLKSSEFKKLLAGHDNAQLQKSFRSSWTATLVQVHEAFPEVPADFECPITEEDVASVEDPLLGDVPAITIPPEDDIARLDEEIGYVEPTVRASESVHGEGEGEELDEGTSMD